MPAPATPGAAQVVHRTRRAPPRRGTSGQTQLTVYRCKLRGNGGHLDQLYDGAVHEAVEVGEAAAA
jgi:hypothetical protein